MPILPIIPSVNTCMSLTTTTTTSCSIAGNVKTLTAVPEFNTSQLQAFADVCSTVNSSATISNAVMNSLVSATKIVTDDNIQNTIASIATSNVEIPKTIPISTIAGTQFLQEENTESGGSLDLSQSLDEKEPLMNVEDEELREMNEKNSLKLLDIVKSNDAIGDENTSDEPMECGSSIASQTSPINMIKALSDDIIMSDNPKNEVIFI